MQIRTAREIPEDESLRRSWNALVQQMDPPEVFYTYEWAIAVQRAYSSSLSPLVLLLYEGDDLSGIASFATRKSGKEAFFLTAATGDYCDFVSHPHRRGEVIDAALSELTRCSVDTLVLANLPSDSPTALILPQAAAACRVHLHVREAYLCARLVLGSPERRQELKLEVNRKKVYRRALRELAKKGSVSIVHERRWSEVARSLSSFYDAHIARFRATGRISNLESPERRKFLDELAKELCQSEWLVLSSLRLGDAVIGWNYGFCFCGSWFWYQPTFDSEYEIFSPGICLLGKIIEAACDTPDIQIVDLGLGSESYKERFATEARQTLHATLNRSWTGHARTAIWHRAASFAKSFPPLERALRASIRALLRIRAWFG